ncbi:hypothetical protein DASC09_026040 [Saccharomycopsis crataegensis]|uniref:Uncharacterized protein n=1 Tax=Saccharomycopsis crataegensis TaxID=43959 RepID=A0AAV5QLF7_9ASCO|nr:hypothetical protein DASC09_026040 [Saccharomycopsis crataegensis]
MFRSSVTPISKLAGLKSASFYQVASLVHARNFSRYQHCLNNNKNNVDQKHLEQFKQQLRSELAQEQSSSRVSQDQNPETEKKSLHTAFYRQVGSPFAKVVALTFVTFYSLRFLWEYLDATDDETIGKKRAENLSHAGETKQ